MPAVDFVEIRLEETPRYENAPSLTPYRLASEKLYLPARSARLRAEPQHLDRDDEMRGIAGSLPSIISGFGPTGALSLRAYWKDLTWLLALAGFDPVVTAGAAGGTSEVQTVTITGTPTGGTFTLTFAGVANEGSHTTAPIAFDATAAVIDAALEALPNIGVGGVTCAGGPQPGTPVTVTFAGRLATRNVPQMTAAASFTGGTTPAIAVTTTTPGVAGSVSDPDGRTLPVGASKWVFTPRDAITPQTAQVLLNLKNHALSQRGQGFALGSLSLNADGELTGDLGGLVLKREAVDSTTVPSFPSSSILPLRRRDILLTWLTGGGAVGDFSVAVENPFARVKTMSIYPQSDFPDVMEVAEGQTRVRGSIPKRSLDADDLDALMAATTFAAKSRWQSAVSIGATSYPYSLWLEMPAAQYLSGGMGDAGNRRRVEGEFDFEAKHSEADGFSSKWTLVNDVTSIATYA